MSSFPCLRAESCLPVRLNDFLLRKRRGLAPTLLALAACLFAPIKVQAWDAVINNQNELPPLFLAVDKSLQKFHILERHSPLTVRGVFDCTTGQADGDKQHEGDLKTPEGVYFIVTKLASGLDFDEYGGLAYTLNYPNPVDRIRSKTGYGIWIHSKGREIVPKETRGCIALNLPDLLSIDHDFINGLPVVVAHTFSTGEISEQDQAVADALADKSRAWAAAWSGRSKDMFAFYDPEGYSKGTESFAAFRSNKERLFGTFPWLHTVIDNVRVMPGPDYWVTWFEQYYRAPNMTTEGIRRLYWQAGADGDLRIVGMEWVPLNLGMGALYLEKVEPEITAFIEQWREAWESGDITAYAQAYASDAVQGGRRGQSAIRQHKDSLWRNAKPVTVDFSGMFLSTDDGGIKADMIQVFKDAKGYSDRGIKTLILTPTATGWEIVREDWSKES